ncbi:hypothetical protein RJ640_000134 [Escallonia rubra]|uniref:Retrotransposon gag domain-containing protein n=1 Tax=Escallonia rubra TaxID=112253 RepID=A0AA88S5C1_9ASTE|nr:hypothetical protein RJ640_000134 [Escallonia rubra]
MKQQNSKRKSNTPVKWASEEIATASGVASQRVESVEDDMVEEFLKLEQGDDETVKDYEVRFARLSRFATHVIDTEERRVTRFKNGLRYGIRKFLTAVTLETYGQVLDKAQRVEKDVEAGRKYYKEQRQKRGREENSSRGNDVVQPKSKNNNLATKEPFKNTQQPAEACKTYGKNHRGPGNIPRFMQDEKAFRVCYSFRIVFVKSSEFLLGRERTALHNGDFSRDFGDVDQLSQASIVRPEQQLVAPPPPSGGEQAS